MRKSILTVCSVMLAIASTAQTLSLEDCVAQAREHYPAVAQYGLLEKTERFNLSNVSHAWLPQGGVSAQATWQNQVAALPELLTNIMSQQGVDYSGLQKTQYKVGVDVSQLIWDGGNSAANRRVISTATEIEKSGIDLQLYDVEGRVQDIYFALLLLDSNIIRTEKSIALTDSTLRQVRAMYANGIAMSSDCDQMEARLLTLQQQKQQLKANRDSYGRILEIFIGEEIGNRTLALPAENEIAVSGFSHPQLMHFDTQLKNISARESGVRASVMPTVGAFISAYYGYPSFDMFKNMRSHNPDFNFLAGIKMSWNFGSLYSRGNNLNKLKLEREKVSVNREIFLFNNGIAESENLGKISSLRKIMENDERIVSLRKSVLDAARSQLRNGVIDTTSLLSKLTDEELAENELSLHRIQLIQALYNLNHIRNK